MSKLLPLAALAIVAGGAGLYLYQQKLQLQNALPPGIASGNGRVEAKQVDIAAREALRVKEILVNEGDLVQKGQVLVKMDTSTLESQRLEAEANVAASEERVAVAKASIARQKTLVASAKIEEERTRKLVEQNAASDQEYEQRKTLLDASLAGLGEEEAKLKTAEQEVLVAEANVNTIRTRIDDATLVAPVQGRVLYRLAENGEVLAAGGKALTLVNLEDVYMEIFLPAPAAGKLKVGSEARLTADHTPDRCVAGRVSFVSPEAQFTPKQVETKSERDKLMFRVKIQVPEELVKAYIERIKTGVRGVGYVKVDDTAQWPDWLASPVGPPPELPPTSGEDTATTAPAAATPPAATDANSIAPNVNAPKVDAPKVDAPSGNVPAAGTVNPTK